MAYNNKPGDFEVVDLGVEYSDYFQGFGTSFTSYQHSVYGIGDTFNAALEDALEMMFQGDHDEKVINRIAKMIEKTEFLTDEDNDKTAVDYDEFEDSDYYPYYHVGIRYTVDRSW